MQATVGIIALVLGAMASSGLTMNGQPSHEQQSAVGEACTNPQSVECHRWVAGIVQGNLRPAFPSIRVDALGDMLIFTDSEAFESEVLRLKFRDTVVPGLSANLCRLGFKNLKVQWSSSTALAEVFELNCRGNAGDKPSAVSPSASQVATPINSAKEQANAHEAVMRFMQGIKIKSLPEGKKLLADTQWIVGAADRGENFYSRPEYTELNSVFASLFETDVPPARGYRELFEMKAMTQGRTTRDVKFLVIAFKDASTGAWKVLDSDDSSEGESEVDIDSQVAYFEAHLRDTRLFSPRHNYATYGHWLLADGRLSEARTALKFASSASTFDGEGHNHDDPIQNLQITVLLAVIDKITVR
jgi:hypothetical protein